MEIRTSSGIHVHEKYTSLNPTFIQKKLGFAGVNPHDFSYFCSKSEDIDCGYSLEPPLRGGSDMYPQSMF